MVLMVAGLESYTVRVPEKPRKIMISEKV